MLNKYVGELIWMVSQDLDSEVYFCVIVELKSKWLKALPIFFMFLHHFVIHFFGHLFIMKV